MKLLNKISTYSLVTASLAFALSSSPVQAQSFTFGNSVDNTSPAGTATQRGQGFQLNVTNISGSPGSKPKAVINSIKFLSTSTVDGTPSFNLASTTIKLYIYSSLPSLDAAGLSALNAGTGALFSNDASSTSTPSITLNDTAFTGNTLAESRTFTFSSPIELDITPSTQYYALFSENIGLRTVTGGYTGGNSYTGTSGTFNEVTGADDRFIINATAVPFEFEASGGIAILGGLFLANKLRKRNQKVETDEQA